MVSDSLERSARGAVEADGRVERRRRSGACSPPLRLRQAWRTDGCAAGGCCWRPLRSPSAPPTYLCSIRPRRLEALVARVLCCAELCPLACTQLTRLPGPRSHEDDQAIVAPGHRAVLPAPHQRLPHEQKDVRPCSLEPGSSSSCDEVAIIPSKRLRNQIAGSVARSIGDTDVAASPRT